MRYQLNISSGLLVVAGGNGPDINSNQLLYHVSVSLDGSSNSLLIVNDDSHIVGSVEFLRSTVCRDSNGMKNICPDMFGIEINRCSFVRVTM